MDIMNRDINLFNSACEIICLYNITIRLDVLIHGSWIIVDSEAKVL